MDLLLVPTTPGHPTVAQVAADPIGANARNGLYTNFVNLLDCCAIAVPAGFKDDGLRLWRDVDRARLSRCCAGQAGRPICNGDLI